MGMDDTDKAPDGVEDPRLASLDDQLRAAHHAKDKLTPKEVSNPFAGKGVSQGNRVLSAIVGTPLGGLIVGYTIDQFAGTRPKVMLVMLFLGIIAGMVQIWKISQERAE